MGTGQVPEDFGGKLVALEQRLELMERFLRAKFGRAESFDDFVMDQLPPPGLPEGANETAASLPPMIFRIQKVPLEGPERTPNFTAPEDPLRMGEEPETQQGAVVKVDFDGDQFPDQDDPEDSYFPGIGGDPDSPSSNDPGSDGDPLGEDADTDPDYKIRGEKSPRKRKQKIKERSVDSQNPSASPKRRKEPRRVKLVKTHKCPLCSRMFSSAASLREHHRYTHVNPHVRFPCPHCKYSSNRKDATNRHVKARHAHKL